MKNQVLLVDDHKLFRKGLRMLVDSLDQFEVCGEACNGLEMLTLLDQGRPDIVVLDIAMPEMDGMKAAKQALQKFPDLKIITISMYGDREHYFKMVDAGVKGFLLKNSEFEEVKMALDAVVVGGTYFSRELLMNLVNTMKGDREDLPADSPLSEREKKVLLLICKGKSTQEIAVILDLSKRTVDSHRAKILSKTGSRNTASLVAYAIEERLIKM
jgi:DNA-binding NarL/FixJ family response regulator